MSAFHDFFFIFFQLFYIITQLIVGSFLLARMKNNKLNNLIPLIFYFFLNAIELFLVLYEVAYIFFQIIVFLPNICIILFTKQVYYKNKKSPYKIVLTTVIILKIFDFILKFFIEFSAIGGYVLQGSEIGTHFIFIGIVSSIVLISYSWLAYASLSYYNEIKEKNIRPWIKKRYLLLGISSVLAFFNGIFYLLIPINAFNLEDPHTFTVVMLIAIFIVAFSIGNLIAWLMPEKLKKYFDKDHELPEDITISEDELLKKIQSELAAGEGA